MMVFKSKYVRIKFGKLYRMKIPRQKPMYLRKVCSCVFKNG